jgi:hypothetical protein
MCADTFTRLVTLDTLCLFLRHLVDGLFKGSILAVKWYHASSWASRCGVILIVLRFALYFFAALSILLMSSFRVLTLGPLVGAFHNCRKGLTIVSSLR